MANIFWSRNGKLFTPSLETGCLPGTTREFVIENIDCEEVVVGIEELRSANEIFLTSAGIGVVQIAEFEGRELQRNDHTIMKLLPSRS
jgi:branched-subunit amino acid aminotransferase/4-amino-4-deoxychorismate lyase